MRALRPTAPAAVAAVAACWLLAWLPAARAGQPQEKAEDAAVKLADMSLDELMNVEISTVTAAARHPQKLAEAPAYVTIVSSDDVRKYGYRTLADILRSVPGLYATYDRNYAHLGVRGFNRPGDYDTRVLLLIDGHRTNDNIYDCPPIGTQGILDVALIDRVEVIRGPGSALYGSNALLAVINVITKRGRDYKGGEAAAGAGTFATWKGRLTFGNAFGDDADLLLSASGYDSAGPGRLYFREYDHPSTSYGVARGCDGDQARNVFAKLSLGEVTFQAAYVTREKGVPTGAWDTLFNDPRTRTCDTRGYLDLKWDHECSERLSIAARLYYDYAAYDGYYAYGPATPVSRDSSRDQWWGAELVLTHTFDRHRLTWGVEYRDNFQQDQHSSDETGVLLDDHRSSRVWAAFAQDEWRLHDSLTLVAGVRHDHYSTFGGTTNPRLSLIWQPFEDTTLKLLYGRAFRAPNAYEMYYHDGNWTQKANADLQPETIETYELVLEQKLTDRLRLAASAFAYTMHDIITLQTDPADGLMVFQNAGGARAKGLELELAGNWPSGPRGRASYSLVRTEDEETGRTLVNSPSHLAKLNVTCPLVKDKLFAGAELQYTSRRLTNAGRHAGAYCLANLTLYARDLPWKGLDPSLSIYNLFDQRYSDPGSTEHRQDTLEQDGRTCWLQLTYRF